MSRFIMPIILIGIAIAVFFTFTNPIFNDISTLKAQVTSYDEALNNSKALENERDKLTQKYNSINPENLTKLAKLLPENVDNIRLILEIEQIAAPHNMILKDVKYSTPSNANSVTSASSSNGVLGGNTVSKSVPKDYGIFELEFSTSGTYDNFINFTKDLESNLRIVDISSVEFSSEGSSSGGKSTTSDIYKYNFKIKTYWLKN